MKPKVGIVLVNYNGLELLREYLPEIKELDYPNIEIVISDNGSNDGSISFLKEHHSDVLLVENEENLGFGKANNIGAQQVPDADYYWFLNTDVLVESESLSVLVQYMENNEKTGIAVPRVNNMGSCEIQSLGYHYDILGRTYKLGQGKSEPSFEGPKRISFGVGAALLIDSYVWNEVGGFDDRNFFYGDDDYICIVAQLLGWDVMVVPESVIYHELGATRIDSFKAYHNARSRFRSHFKLIQRKNLPLGILGFVAFTLIRVMIDLFVRQESSVAMARVRGLLSGISDLKRLIRERKDLQNQRIKPDGEIFDPIC